MEEDYNMVRGIDKLAELLIERGIEFCVNDEVSLAFKDDVGNLHECWMAGANENCVNALITVTPEQLLSVPDLNGIIAENANLRELCSALYEFAYDEYPDSAELNFADRMRDLRIEVSE